MYVIRGHYSTVADRVSITRKLIQALFLTVAMGDTRKYEKELLHLLEGCSTLTSLIKHTGWYDNIASPLGKKWNDVTREHIKEPDIQTPFY